MIYINKALVQWSSKKQPMIDNYVFRAEFVATDIVMETLRGLRYNLWMMGISLWGMSNIYGDNISVIHNTHRLESTLYKKSKSICYRAIQESVTMVKSMTTWVPKGENPANYLTKVLYGSKWRPKAVKLNIEFVSSVLFGIFGWNNYCMVYC